MAIKERFQNPVINDTINLRLFSYNSNNRANFNSAVKVEIFFLDPTEITDANPRGKRLIETVLAANITLVETGQYQIGVNVLDPTYTEGKYLDVWHVDFEPNDTLETTTAEIENVFEIFPDLWYTTPLPIIYDFNFAFRPNKIRTGSKRFLVIDIIPNVPSSVDLNRYFENLAIVSPLRISIEQSDCNECIPAEKDLRLVVDCAAVEIRDKCKGYYFLDTTEIGLDLAIGLYNVWFTMEFGESTYISDTQQLQIFE